MFPSHVSRRLAFAALVMIVVAACSPATPRPPPSGPADSATGTTPGHAVATPAIPGITWVKATSVARPDEAFAGASALPTQPSGPGTAGHPGHFPGQAIVDDIVSVGKRGVAVGYVGVRGSWTAIAWTSDDQDTWTLSPIDETAGSFAVSLAVGVGGGPAAERIVAGGRVAGAPATWDSTDGRSWTRRDVPTLVAGGDWERIVTVAATGSGFIAGGSVGPELGDRRARFWRSPDGLAWQPIPDDPAFAGGEVVAIAGLGDGFVALGRLGTGQRATGSVAWVSPDGQAWQRIDDPDLTAGLVAAVTLAPDGSLLAVGSDLDERAALVWRSADGRAWTRLPDEESRLYHGKKIRMTDVATTPEGGFAAVGNFVGVQFGTGTSWTSDDGVTWRRAAGDAALQQGELLAVDVGPSEFLASGSFGAPDNYIPTIWRSPLSGG